MSRNLLLVATLAPLLACAVDAKKPDTAGKPAKKPPACVAGTGGCEKCTKNGKKCEVCSPGTTPEGAAVPTGTYVTGKGVCQACPDEGCAKCRKASGTCVTCVTGSALKGKKCVPCGDGFVVSKGRCKKAPKPKPENEDETETESGDT